jgi:hypothetical protein
LEELGGSQPNWSKLAGFRVFYEQIYTNSVLAVTSLVAGLEFSTSAAAGDDAESARAAEDSVRRLPYGGGLETHPGYSGVQSQ